MRAGGKGEVLNEIYLWRFAHPLTQTHGTKGNGSSRVSPQGKFQICHRLCILKNDRFNLCDCKPFWTGYSYRLLTDSNNIKQYKDFRKTVLAYWDDIETNKIKSNNNNKKTNRRRPFATYYQDIYKQTTKRYICCDSMGKLVPRAWRHRKLSAWHTMHHGNCRLLCHL